jgi:hypothetical protein
MDECLSPKKLIELKKVASVLVTKSLLFVVLVGGGRHATQKGLSHRDDVGSLSETIKRHCIPFE